MPYRKISPGSGSGSGGGGSESTEVAVTGTSGPYLQLTPNPDGIEIVFTTPNEYKAETLRVLVNGVVTTQFTETDSETFTMTVAPPAGNEVMAIYEPV